MWRWQEDIGKLLIELIKVWMVTCVWGGWQHVSSCLISPFKRGCELATFPKRGLNCVYSHPLRHLPSAKATRDRYPWLQSWWMWLWVKKKKKIHSIQGNDCEVGTTRFSLCHRLELTCTFAFYVVPLSNWATAGDAALWILLRVSFKSLNHMIKNAK